VYPLDHPLRRSAARQLRLDSGVLQMDDTFRECPAWRAPSWSDVSDFAGSFE
jgi:hypothetical protein